MILVPESGVRALGNDLYQFLQHGVDTMKHLRLWPKVLICLFLCGCIITTATGCLSSFLPVKTATEDDSAPAYQDKLEEVLSVIDQYYVDEYDEEALGDYLAQAAVAATGDRWSYYISAEDYAEYVEQNNNAYVGIGVTIERPNEEDPGVTITKVTHNGPAEAAGIQIGDMIVGVDGQSTAGMDMDETKELVRGEEGTEVTLTILRDGEEIDIAITRAVIETDVVVYEMMDNGIGYIKINNFEARSSSESIAAVDELISQGAAALVFDLRFNPGGLKSELVKLLDHLLPEGPLFRSVDFNGKEEIDYSDESCIDIPMAVIVNDDSYSAAEFFASALQEYDAAVIVGTQTCGKANYQQTFRLSDGSAIAISTGHYQTPNGVTLADVGVTPDIIVEVDDETYLNLYYEKIKKMDDEQLQTAINALKSE